MSKLHSELQSLSPSALVEMFELNLTAKGGPVYRFCADTNPLTNDIVWQGNQYTRLPIEAEGFAKNSNGTLPRPTLRISNILGSMASLARQYGYFLGCKLVRKRTFARFLDAVNYPTPEPRRNLLNTSQNFDEMPWESLQAGGGTRPMFSEEGIDPPPTPDGAVIKVFFQIPTAASGGTFHSSVVSQPIEGLTVGQTYTASFYVKGEAGKFISLFLNGTPTSLELDGQWQRLEKTHTATTTYTTFQIGLSNNSGVSTISGVVELCSAQYERANSATDTQEMPRTYVMGVDADPTQHLQDEIWFIDRKATENSTVMEFELASILDMQGVMLPRRQMIQNLCVSRYRGPECSYNGGPVAKADGTPTSDPAQDVCGKRLSDCKLRFREGPIPYGGFPGVGLVK